MSCCLYSLQMPVVVRCLMRGRLGKSAHRSACYLTKHAIKLYQRTAGICRADYLGRTQGLPEEGPQRAAYVDAAIAAALEHFPESRHVSDAATEEPVAASTRTRLMVRCISSHNAMVLITQ